MNGSKRVCVLSAGVLGASLAGAASGQELFRDQMNDGTNWGVNSTADTAATFGYDYSADFIPEAPNSRGGDDATTGLKLEANLVNPAAAASQTVYPIGENFTGDYRLRFDAWINFSEDNFYNNGAAGTTEFIGGGIGYDDTSADIGPGVQIIATGDGGSGSDWRAFDAGSFLSTSEMIAGTRNGFDPYYSNFLPNVSSPAGQQTDFGGSVAGSPGFQWVVFEVQNVGGRVTIDIEDTLGNSLPITVIDGTGDTDGNIGLFYADFFSSVTNAPGLQFGIIDNVEVDVPEPATAALLGLGALAMLRRRA